MSNRSLDKTLDIQKKKKDLIKKPSQKSSMMNNYPEDQFISNKINVETTPNNMISIMTSADSSSSINTPQKINIINKLQSSHGNRYLKNILQEKLYISQPGDAYEQEADRIAEKVANAHEPVAGKESVQRREREIPLKYKSKTVSNLQNTTNVSSIKNIENYGRPLNGSERNFFEQRFGYDLSQIRIHTGAQADVSAKMFNAKAFTIGKNIVFAKDEYSTSTLKGQNLLAHELTHVLQQNAPPHSYKKINTQPNTPLFERNQIFKDVNLENIQFPKKLSASKTMIQCSFESSKGELSTKEITNEEMKPTIEEIPYPTSEEMKQKLSPKKLKAVKLFFVRINRGVNSWKNTPQRFREGRDFLSGAAAVWDIPEYKYINPLNPRLRLFIQQHLVENYDHSFIETLRDIYEEHYQQEKKGATKKNTLWVISDILGIRVEPGLNPYRIRTLWEGRLGAGVLLKGAGEVARVVVQKWNKNKKRIMWQDDFVFVIGKFGVGYGIQLKLKSLGGIAKKILEKALKHIQIDVEWQPWMDNVCGDIEFKYEGDDKWKTFETEVNWTPQDFEEASLGYFEGPSLSVVFGKGKTIGFLAINHKVKGTIALPFKYIFDWELRGLSIDLLKMGRGTVLSGFLDPEKCDPDRVEIEPEDLDIPEIEEIIKRNTRIQFKVGRWKPTVYKLDDLKRWLQSEPIQTLLSYPNSKLEILGHGSPFWASAKSFDEMLKNNLILSRKRAKFIESFVNTVLKDKLKASVIVKGLGCKEAIDELGEPVAFRGYNSDYNRFQRVDLIINHKLILRVTEF